MFSIEEYGFEGCLPKEIPFFEGVKYEFIFLFYDGPILYTCRTPRGLYLGMLLNAEQNLYETLYFPITEETLGRYVRNEKDLLSVLKESIDGKVFRVFLSPEPKMVEEVFSDLRESDLPREGLYAGKDPDLEDLL